MSTGLDFSLPLSDLLREGTKGAHSDLEESAGAGHLVRGELSREEYARYLMMLWHIYNTFEQALDGLQTHATLSPTYNPALLARGPSVSSDIAAILDIPESSWKSHPIHTALLANPPPALTAYTDRLTELSLAEDPSALLAHSYVRYLGDLSGGQQIRRTIARAYGLDEATGSSGLQFYDFKELGGTRHASQGDMKKIKDWFRAGMNAGARDDPSVKAAVVAEANTAFTLNAGIFSSLQAPSKPTPSEKPADIFSAATKGKQIVIESVPPAETTFPLSSILAVVGAVCLAHGLLVVGGFTGAKGYDKLVQVEDWFGSLFTGR